MSYVITHPDVEGEAVIAERSLLVHARKGWVISDRTGQPTDTGRVQPMEQPNRSAGAAEWKTYAVVSGMPYEKAMAATRDELVEHYNPTPKAAPAVKIKES